MPVPNVGGKERLDTAYGANHFVSHLRGNGWDPGPLPSSVIFTYGGFDLLCSAQPGNYSVNPMLGLDIPEPFLDQGFAPFVIHSKNSL